MAQPCDTLLPSPVYWAFTFLFPFLTGLLNSLLLFLPDASNPHSMCSLFSSVGPGPGGCIRMANCSFAYRGKRHNGFAACFGNSHRDRFQSVPAFGADATRTLAHRSESALRHC